MQKKLKLLAVVVLSTMYVIGAYHQISNPELNRVYNLSDPVDQEAFMQLITP